jgi:hypothetical protein
MNAGTNCEDPTGDQPSYIHVTTDNRATHLKVYDGDINFATDAWTSPNHYAYVALTAHFETQGQPIAIVLDVVEVPEVLSSC